ncbi:hypothetical protein ACFQZE_19310 [Paenibacillus sp. GCM10027627]|uniref:glycan biosynthesis hexose transferase WsfD n=1 Tax=unclassified Paenibacillus TaxID=185978 RepID=UPI00362B4AEB
MAKRIFTVENVYLLAAAAIAAVLLLGKTFVGVADNGDFLRIMGTAGLNYGNAAESFEERFFSYSHSRFAYDSFFRGFYLSSQIALVVAARFVGKLLNSEYFDIRVVGVFYTLLHLAAGYLIIKWNKSEFAVANVLFAGLMLIVFMDIAYLAYFNSLYGEPVSLVFMLLALALALMISRSEAPSRLMLALFFAAAIFLACSKTQNAPIGIGFALIGLRFLRLRRDRSWRKLALVLTGTTMLASLVMYVAAPGDFKRINLYQTVFFGILHESPDVEGDLKTLGLPPHLSVLAGTNYFQKGTAIPQNDPSLEGDFYSRISHFDVLAYYAAHPGRLLDKLEYAANYSMEIRPYYLGSYEKSEGKPPRALSFQFSGWSEFKRHVIPNELWFVAGFFVLFFAGAVYEWARADAERKRAAAELFALLGLTGVFSFMIPVLGDGVADLSKHLFLFNVVFDMMAVTSAVWLLFKASALLRKI